MYVRLIVEEPALNGGKGLRLNVPAPVMNTLQAEYYRTAAQNTLLFRELDKLLAPYPNGLI